MCDVFADTQVDMEESAVELLLKILLQSVFSYRKEKNMTDWCTEFITATKNCDVWGMLVLTLFCYKFRVD